MYESQMEQLSLMMTTSPMLADFSNEEFDKLDEELNSL
jgi:hypothetical protein